MLILVACEESQAVTIALRKLGHIAFSCDVQECSGGHPEWHLLQDVREVLNGDTTINIQGGAGLLMRGKWDMIIAFPPSIELFMAIANADCDKVAIENPVGTMSTVYRKPDQIVQPYEFGDLHHTRTCLWLKNLPKLQPTKGGIAEAMATQWAGGELYG